MNFAEFIKSNLISGFRNGSFTGEQVNIYSMNYLLRGNITQEDFDEIQLALNPPEPESAQ
jgi:hypothetical protein